MCTGSVPWPYITAGIWLARRILRAAPLPNVVRLWACRVRSVTAGSPGCGVAAARGSGARDGGRSTGRASTRGAARRGAPERTASITEPQFARRPSPRQPGKSSGSLAGAENALRAGQAGRVCSGLAVEQAGDRPVVEDLADGAGDERRDRQHGQLRELVLLGDRQRVADDDLADPAVLEPVDRGAGQDRVGGGDDDLGGAVLEQGLGRLGDRPGGVDHVVDQHAGAALHLTDHLVHAHLVGDVRVAALVDDRERGTEPVRPLVGLADPAGVRRDDREVRPVDPAADVLGQQRQRPQVVDRPVEVALDLGGVQVDADQAVGTGGLEQVGHQPGRDRLPAAVLLVLPGVAVERHDAADPLGRRALERVGHQQLLHDPLVDRRGVALDDERVAAAQALLEAHVDLAVGEVVGRGVDQLDAQLVRDLLGELAVAAAADEHEALLAVCGDTGHDRGVPSEPLESSGRGASGGSVRWAGCWDRARSAAWAAGVPARWVSVQPSRLRCGATLIARAPGGTSLRTTVPAPEYAPSPTVTGATNIVSEPVRQWLPMVVRDFVTPS